MSSTLFLDPAVWDLTLDANNNIAVAPEPYALAQDAASAIKTFLGEVYWNTSIGVPYLQQIFGFNPPLALLKQYLVQAALSASPNIASAQVFLSSLDPATRILSGQVQLVSVKGQTSAATFTTGNLTGGAQ
jgi:hypothetical protein